MACSSQELKVGSWFDLFWSDGQWYPARIYEMICDSKAPNLRRDVKIWFPTILEDGTWKEPGEQSEGFLRRWSNKQEFST